MAYCEGKTERLTIRLRPEDKDMIDDIAERESRPLSEVARDVILKGVRAYHEGYDYLALAHDDIDKMALEVLRVQ